MSRLSRYTLVALGAIALSVTSYAIGNATAQDVGPEGAGSNPGLRSPSGSALAPMPALGAESAYMGSLVQRDQWDTALRWIALADVGSGASTREDEGRVAGDARPGSVKTPGPAPSGDCYGGPVPDSIVTRESQGQPFVQNSGGYFGCFQIGQAWWSGRCSHLDRYSVPDQKACAQIILDTQGPSAWAL